MGRAGGPARLVSYGDVVEPLWSIERYLDFVRC